MIFVHDLPRMAAFYEGALGLKPIAESRLDNYVEFETGGTCFALHAIPNEAGRTQSFPVTPRETVPVKLSFEVQDPAMERLRLERLGVRVIERPWGSCEYVDPEGNIFGIVAAGTA